ncbi:uncharacterized protein LOC119342197 isoform X4 [Triticum dicoccoides]|uniref:uncharacterized protein LOC119342197 isoform X4 n=1 Tax=Triticum dicoccoides TaxID=85692 RepID=UPI001891D7F7|nr:uncharacterized protein LOC119342197 isoform X4 [Triticum dicoccoides]
MRMSYSPTMRIFLFLMKWTNCSLAGTVYVDGTTTMSTHDRKASIREINALYITENNSIVKHLNGAHIGMPRFILESLGCLMRSCSSAGRCKAQLRRGSSPVGRHSGATPARTEYCLGYNLPRNSVHMKEKKGIQYLALTLGAWATARTSTYRLQVPSFLYMVACEGRFLLLIQSSIMHNHLCTPVYPED